MPRFQKIDQGYAFVTSTVKNWNIYEDQDLYFNTMINELNFRIDKGEMELAAYVIMPNHFHLLGYFEDIPNAMKKLKSFTSKKLRSRIQSNEEAELFKKEFWEKSYYAVNLFSKKYFMQKFNYIHENPSRAGLVENDLDWKYSSLRNYYLGNGVLPIGPWPL